MTDEQRNTATANRLAQALQKSGLTQQELSDRSGVAKSSISQYIHGVASPSPGNSQKLAKVLNVDEGWLMGFDTPANAGNVKKDDTLMANYANLSEKEKISLWEILQKLATRGD